MISRQVENLLVPISITRFSHRVKPQVRLVSPPAWNLKTCRCFRFTSNWRMNVRRTSFPLSSTPWRTVAGEYGAPWHVGLRKQRVLSARSLQQWSFCRASPGIYVFIFKSVVGIDGSCGIMFQYGCSRRTRHRLVVLSRRYGHRCWRGRHQHHCVMEGVSHLFVVVLLGRPHSLLSYLAPRWRLFESDARVKC